jgi:tetratricopeptide (TPR) repeat protein
VALKKALQLAPGNFGSLVTIIATYSLLGREEEARAAAKKVLETSPNVTLERARALIKRRYKNPADVKHIIPALRKAGLPELGKVKYNILWPLSKPQKCIVE